MIEKLIENWLINVHELGYTIPFCEVLISRGYTIVRISRQGRGELGKDVIARTRNGELHTFQLKGPKDIKTYMSGKTFKTKLEISFNFLP